MSRSQSEQPLVWALRAAAALAGSVLLVVTAFVVQEALPAWRAAGFMRFFRDSSWYPLEGSFGLLPMLAGTLFVTAGAVVLAAPLGVASAIFLHHHAPVHVARFYRRLIELLGGVPSVVFGFWGLVVLVPIIGRFQPPGTSLLAGILIVALMILPTIALMVDAAIAKVPEEYLLGAAALGLTRWATTMRVVLPAARSGISTGVLLGTARAIGETMAVIMVCGNVVEVPRSLFAPLRTLTANIALEMSYAMGEHRSALFVSGLLLMSMVALLVGAAELLSRGRLHG